MRNPLCATLLAAALACSNPAPTSDTLEGLQHKKVSVNAEFTLEEGQSASLDGGRLIIGFDGVANDSRCPADAVCVWQGDAAMVFHLSSEILRIAARRDTLHTALDPKTASYVGYTIAVLGLQPYPYSSDDPASRDYSVTMKVTSAGQ